MSDGRDPTPSPKRQTDHKDQTVRNLPKHQTVPSSLYQRRPNNLQSTSTAIDPATTRTMAPNLPRRGFVTPNMDFDALMYFDTEPAAPSSPQPKSKKRKRDVKVREEMDVSMACYSTADTPPISWLERARAMEAEKRPSGGTSAPNNGGEGSSRGAGTMGSSSTGSTAAGEDAGGSSAGVGVASGSGSGSAGGSGDGGVGSSKAAGGSKGKGKGRAPAKRAARRAPTQPKRQYTWRDPLTKNKGSKKDPKGKGKAKE
jgi:hypothetical protein